MSDWISVAEAGNLLGLSHNRVRERAHGGDWGFRIERVDSRHGSTRKMFVRADDVRLVAEGGGRQKALAACAVSREGDVSLVQRLVDWADSLTQWPPDDEIAAILAHEIGHIAARHSVKRLQASLGYTLLRVLALVASKDARFKRGTDIALSQLMLGYSRDDELLADKLAVKYINRAGYNPEAIISLLEKLERLETNAPIRPLVASYMRTHPYLPERIAAVRREIYGIMEFTDYINRPSYYSNISR